MKPAKGEMTVLRVEVDGRAYDGIVAIGIGHTSKALVLVPAAAVTGSDKPIELLDWQRVNIDKQPHEGGNQ